MFNVYLGLILFSIQSTDVAASNVLHKPRNGFVTVGDSTTVICESDDPNDEIQLYSGGVIDKKLVGEQIGYVNSNEVVVTHSKGYRYKVTRMLTTNTIKMTIEIASVSILDKIGFYCWTKLNHTVFVATYFIYVHGLVPFTDVSANGAVVEEDEISLGCYGHYYGRRSPRLHWSRTNSIPNGIAWETRVPGRKLWEERKSNAVELGVHYATLTTTVKREMHGFMYKCATGDYYDNKISLAINISDNGTKWSLYRPRSAASYTFQPLVVYYKPSVTISPLNDTYVVGDRITMEVDARPMPGTYEWVGLSLNMVFKSRRLTITRHMVGNQTFVATATNNLLGKNLKGEYQFSFFVPTPPPRPTTTVSYKEHWVHVGRPHTSQVKMPAAQKRGTSLLFLKLFFLITLLSGICIGGLVLRKKTAKMTVVNEETYDVYETDDVSQVTGSDAVDDTVAVTGIQQQQQQLQQQYVAMPSIPKTSVEVTNVDI